MSRDAARHGVERDSKPDRHGCSLKGWSRGRETAHVIDSDTVRFCGQSCGLVASNRPRGLPAAMTIGQSTPPQGGVERRRSECGEPGDGRAEGCEDALAASGRGAVR